MAYDLPFMSKARKAIPRLPTNPPRTPLVDEVEYGGYNANTPPWLQGTNVGEPIQYEDVRRDSTPADQVLNTRYWREFGGDTSTPDWLRGTQVGEPITPAPAAPESVWQGPVRPGYRRNPQTGFPEPIPEYAMPTSIPIPNETRSTITQLSSQEEQRIDIEQRKKSFGQSVEEDPAAPGSVFFDSIFTPNLDPAHLAANPVDYRFTPGGTRIPLPGIDRSIPIPYEGAIGGAVHLASTFAEFALMPEDAAMNTVINIMQGAPPTIWTEGFGPAVEEYRNRSFWVQALSPLVATSGIVLATKAGSRTARIAGKRSARSDRGLVTAYNPDPRFVPSQITKNSSNAAEALNNAIDDIIRSHGGIATQRTTVKFGDDIDAYEVVTPNALNLRMIEGGLDNNNLMGSITHTLKDKSPFSNMDDYLVPIVKDADRKLATGGSVDNAANVLSSKIDFIVRKHFDLDSDGLVRSLRNIDRTLDKDVEFSPGLQDIAERLPTFAPYLTKETDGITQLQAMEEIRRLLQPWSKLFSDVGLETPEGARVMEGGFYMPRGSKEVIQKEFEGLNRYGRSFKSAIGTTRRGFEMDRDFPSYSMGAGSIKRNRDKGVPLTFEYPDIRDTIRYYINDVGERAIGEHTLQLLKLAKDRNGISSLVQSPAMRMELLHGPLQDSMIKLRNRVSYNTQKGLGQEGITSEILRQRKVQIKEVAQSAVEVSRRQMKVQDLHVNGADARILNRMVDEAIAAGKSIKNEVAETTRLIRENRGDLSKIEHGWATTVSRYMAELEDLAAFKNRADWEHENITPYQGVWEGGTYRERKQLRDMSDQYRPMRNYFASVNRLNRMHRLLDTMVDESNRLEGVYDDLISSRVALKDFSTESRQQVLDTRRELRLQNTRDLQERSLLSAIKVWEMEEYRRLRKLAATEGRLVKYQQARAATSLEVVRLKDNLKQVKSKWDGIRESQPIKLPPGRGIIKEVRGLEHYDFPVAMSAAVNKYLEKSVGEPTLGREAAYINNQYRGFKATGDDSVLFIQGLLNMVGVKGMMPATENFGNLMKMHAQSWADPRVRGGFMIDYDKKQLRAGRLTSEEWSTLSRTPLRIGGVNTEYSLRGVAERLPVVGSVVRASNRAFGYYGDAARLNLAADMLELELTRGRTLKEIVDAGDADRIADIANNMTGWSSRRSFGSLGDFALLAPRFLQARVETLYKAALGTLPVMTKHGPKFGYSLDHRMARRAMTRLMMYSAITTELINTMQGKETDWRPIIKGPDGSLRWNPNFMRFHIPFVNLDATLLGPYDSLLRMGFGVSVGLAHLAQDKNLDRWEDVLEPFRPGASGIVSNVIDFFFDKRDFKGNTFDNPEEIAKRLGLNAVPITAEQSVENGLHYFGQKEDFDWVNIPKTAGSVLIEGIGLKAVPESMLDLRQNLANEIIAAMPQNERDALRKTMEPSFYDKLSGQEFLYDNLPLDFKIKHIMNNPDILKAAQDKPPRYMGTIEERTAHAQHLYSEGAARYEDIVFNQILQGAYGKTLDKAISDMKANKFRLRSDLLKHGDIGEHLSKRQQNNKLDLWVQHFWDVELPILNPISMERDWDTQEADQEAIVIEAYDDLGKQMGLTMEEFRKRFDSPMPTGNSVLDDAVMQNYNWHKAAQPVYDAAEVYMQQFSPEERLAWQQHQTAQSVGDIWMFQNDDRMGEWQKGIDIYKTGIRRSEVDENGYHYIDAALMNLGIRAYLPEARGDSKWGPATIDGWNVWDSQYTKTEQNRSRYEQPAVLRPDPAELQVGLEDMAR